MAKPKGALRVVPKAVEPPALKAVKAAIEGQLRKLIDEGVSVQTLGVIERFCHSQREALAVIEHPKALVRSRFGLGGGMIGNYSSGYVQPQMAMGYSEDDSGGDGAMAPAPQVETYGANAMREFTAALSKMGERRQSITDLVTALKLAKEDGLTEVAETISKQIDEVCGKKASTK